MRGAEGCSIDLQASSKALICIPSLTMNTHTSTLAEVCMTLHSPLACNMAGRRFVKAGMPAESQQCQHVGKCALHCSPAAAIHFAPLSLSWGMVLPWHDKIQRLGCRQHDSPVSLGEQTSEQAAYWLTGPTSMQARRHLACLQCRCLALHGGRRGYRAAHRLAGAAGHD